MPIQQYPDGNGTECYYYEDFTSLGGASIINENTLKKADNLEGEAVGQIRINGKLFGRKLLATNAYLVGLVNANSTSGPKSKQDVIDRVNAVFAATEACRQAKIEANLAAQRTEPEVVAEEPTADEPEAVPEPVETPPTVPDTDTPAPDEPEAVPEPVETPPTVPDTDTPAPDEPEAVPVPVETPPAVPDTDTPATQEENADAETGADVGTGTTAGSGVSTTPAEVSEPTSAEGSAPGGNDWRVRLSLGPRSEYLYKNPAGAGILAPLIDTDGVIFPYTPTVNVTYAASYDSTSPVHSNFKINQYTASSVDTVTIGCTFTAQDTKEANYLLACIHFFRSMTKMFYGQDESPKNGTPPPLAFLYGMGAFQFEGHPLAITNFTYNLPADVDYIKATNSSDDTTAAPNLVGGQLTPGGGAPPPNFQTAISDEITYVPTKITMSIQCIPIISRNQISSKFSLSEYAQGKLNQGSKRPGGGIW